MITDRHCWPLMATDGHPWPLSRCAGTSDPYATLSSAGQIRRTRVIPKTLNPIWEEEIVMQGALAEFVGNAHGNGNGNGNAPLGIRSGLIVRVFDSESTSADDPMAKDTLIGEAFVSLDGLRTENVIDFEAELKPQGRIFGRMEWVPVAGKPGEKRRRAIAAAGGVTRVISMLHAIPNKKTATRMWELTAGVLGMDQSAALAASAADAQHPERAAAAPSVVGIQEQAAATLGDLTYSDQTMQESIIAQGAVGPLLKLIRLGSSLAQENAARTIWHLCASTANQGALVEAGAISELVALSRSGSVKAQELAAAVISDLAKGAILEREAREALRQPHPHQHPHQHQQKESAGGDEGGDLAIDEPRAAASASASREKQAGPLAIVSSLECHVEARASEGMVVSFTWAESTMAEPTDVEDAGAEASPMGLSRAADDPTATTTSERGAAATAAALPATTAGGGDRLSAIAAAGGIIPLVALVTTGAPLSKERAASALWHLSVDAGNQLAIAKAGGIGPLVQLLDDGTEQAAVYAAEALDRLARNNADIQTQVAKKLVSL